VRQRNLAPESPLGSPPTCQHRNVDARAPTALVLAILLSGCGSRTSVLLGQPADASAPDANEVPDAYEAPDVAVPPPPFDAGTDASSCNQAVVVGEVPPVHRPVAARCGPSGSPYGPDAGPVACAADGGCPDVDTGNQLIGVSCIGGLCALQDQCFDDSDCGQIGNTRSVCACSSAQVFPGVAVQPNTCVPGICRVDSDCGPGKYCVLSLSLGCHGGGYGYYCTTAADRCVDPTIDCTTCPGKSCVYERQVGWWDCSSAYAEPCNG
jgi:hypothetical protein